MLALVYDESSKSLRLDHSFPKPDPGTSGAVIKIHRAGICATVSHGLTRLTPLHFSKPDWTTLFTFYALNIRISRSLVATCLGTTNPLVSHAFAVAADIGYGCTLVMA